jgi:hypothetical protein
VTQNQTQTSERPVIGHGDFGYNVKEVQHALDIEVDGDFGPDTDDAVSQYQREKDLDVDGVVGPQTWKELTREFDLPPYPPKLPTVFTPEVKRMITDTAIIHPIADYNWEDRGKAPAGYIKGMALAYAQAYVRFGTDDFLAIELSKANTHDSSVDALAWLAQEFEDANMSNSQRGKNTLRHLYVLLMGLGMRESSGEHCCGRDQSAENTTADTCEAGLFQTSWNARSACTDFINLFDQYELSSPQGYLSAWEEDVSCSQSDWDSYGSGDGFMFQELCKRAPTFAVETCAVTLRNLRQHYGPINRREVELRREADDMFKRIELIVEGEVFLGV